METNHEENLQQLREAFVAVFNKYLSDPKVTFSLETTQEFGQTFTLDLSKVTTCPLRLQLQSRDHQGSINTSLLNGNASFTINGKLFDELCKQFLVEMNNRRQREYERSIGVVLRVLDNLL